MPPYWSERLEVHHQVEVLSGRQPPEGPPVWMALKGRPPRAAAAGVDKVAHGAAQWPARSITCALTEPMRVNSLVPLLFSVPIAANHSRPLIMIWGTHDMVSVLFTTVGRLNRPASTERGGLVRGMARLPSIPNMRADASPEM